MHTFAFSHTPSLKPVLEICRNGKRHKYVNENWLNKLNWQGIAFWFMDDGSMMLSKKHRLHIEFSTQGFSFDECLLLQSFLLKYGLNTRLNKTHGKEYHSLASRHHVEVFEFAKNVQPYIIPSMMYKINKAINYGSLIKS